MNELIKFLLAETPSAAYSTFFGAAALSIVFGLWYWLVRGKYRGWRIQVLGYEGEVRLETIIETEQMIGIAHKPLAGSRDLKSFASNVGFVYAFPYNRDGKFEDPTNTFSLDWAKKVVTIDFRNNPPAPARMERPKAS